MVEKAKEYIGAGDIYQAKLSQRFAFKCQGSSLAALWEASHYQSVAFLLFLENKGP